MLRGAFRAADFHTSVKRLSSTFCFSLIIYKDSSTEARAVSVAKPLRVPKTTASDFLISRAATAKSESPKHCSANRIVLLALERFWDSCGAPRRQ